MKRLHRRFLIPALLGATVALAAVTPRLLPAQNPWGYAPSTTPASQRSAQGSVQAQVQWLRNATRNAPNYLSGSYEMVWQQFITLRGTYNSFGASLTPRQTAYGANELEQLNAGLDIIEEAFSGFQEDVAAGRSSSLAFRRMCEDLDEASVVWLKEVQPLLFETSGRLVVNPSSN